MKSVAEVTSMKLNSWAALKQNGGCSLTTAKKGKVSVDESCVSNGNSERLCNNQSNHEPDWRGYNYETAYLSKQ